jgi:4'-phosphopantetheinyl transferase
MLVTSSHGASLHLTLSNPARPPAEAHQTSLERRVDVWLTDPVSLDDGARDRRPHDWFALLDPEERERNARFLIEPPRRLDLAARVLLRQTLSHYRAVDPRDWRFGRNAYGRPYVEAPEHGRTLHFNLSHTDGLVALAVSEAPDIGVDVEIATRDLDCERLAISVFAPAELEAYRRVAAGERRSAFFVLWTLKEAYIKARGMGLHLPLDGFAFDLSGSEPSITFNARCPDDAARWRFRHFAPTPAHRLGLAMPAGIEDLRVLWRRLGAETAGA